MASGRCRLQQVPRELVDVRAVMDGYPDAVRRKMFGYPPRSSAEHGDGALRGPVGVRLPDDQVGCQGGRCRVVRTGARQADEASSSSRRDVSDDAALRGWSSRTRHAASMPAKK